MSGLRIVLIIAFAGTQLCALKAKVVPFASSTTFSLAPAFCQLLTALGNWWECRPHYLPNFTFFSPPPVGRALCMHLTYSYLAPDTGSLISGTLHVLCKRCPCRWNGFIGPLLPSKQVKYCIINPISSAVLVVHCDDKLLKHATICIICYWWVLTELLEDMRHFRAHFPGLPCSLFDFTMKG